ncbi:MAG: methionine--tRNA ligase subunit beta [Candidatus Omnitrophica bacterium]|nr:methionine--tRNA ligase subunit beta [Candidatus Omnitrophota bacterium]
MEKVSFNDFKKVDIRVAEIVEAKEHPNADKLVVLKIKVGDEEKQIVAGIKAFYGLEQLRGKKIIVVNNLEPAQLRGETSEGMLLAVRGNDGLGLLTVDKDMPSGAVVS